MKKPLLGATALALCAVFSSVAYADFTLNILHINDFHSRFDLITGSNYDCNAEDDAAGDNFQGSIVVDVAGERIGIIGATTEDTPEISSPGKDVEFTDIVQYVRGASEALDADGVNKIIVLSHIGYTADMDMAATLPLLDVIVGGHSHTLLSNTDEAAIGPYPTMVTNPEGVEVLVVQAIQYGKHLGDIAITWDDNGVVTKAEGEPFLVDASVAGNDDFKTQLADLATPLAEAMNVVIGTSAGPIEGSREIRRATECEMGNLVAEAMLDRAA
ncbi:MAG: hypothetical protein MO852_05380, partial [Candidatus Devosia euplotis]|nr:hypothetical protein [Candidatus Devosia euplotis]